MVSYIRGLALCKSVAFLTSILGDQNLKMNKLKNSSHRFMTVPSLILTSSPPGE